MFVFKLVFLILDEANILIGWICTVGAGTAIPVGVVW